MLLFIISSIIAQKVHLVQKDHDIFILSPMSKYLKFYELIGESKGNYFSYYYQKLDISIDCDNDIIGVDVTDTTYDQIIYTNDTRNFHIEYEHHNSRDTRIFLIVTNNIDTHIVCELNVFKYVYESTIFYVIYIFIIIAIYVTDIILMIICIDRLCKMIGKKNYPII